VDDPDDIYGVGQIELTLGHGDQVGGHHYRWAREHCVGHGELVAGFAPSDDVPQLSPYWWQIHAARFPEELYSTNFVTERTIDFIETSEAAGEPWMAWCSCPDPHHPLSPPAQWFERHDPDDISLAATFEGRGEGWTSPSTIAIRYGASRWSSNSPMP
jgi:hypothetical protein